MAHTGFALVVPFFALCGTWVDGLGKSSDRSQGKRASDQTEPNHIELRGRVTLVIPRRRENFGWLLYKCEYHMRSEESLRTAHMGEQPTP